MKVLSCIFICFLFEVICTSCEKYESLNEKFYDVYGTWKLINYTNGSFAYTSPGIDHLTIVRSDEKKIIEGKFSKFADYQAHLEGELVESGEICITNQYDNVVWIYFTNNPFPVSNQIAIESLDENQMFLNAGHPEYTLPTYSFIKIPSPSD
jgi:hypothetical protein